MQHTMPRLMQRQLRIIFVYTIVVIVSPATTSTICNAVDILTYDTSLQSDTYFSDEKWQSRQRFYEFGITQYFYDSEGRVEYIQNPSIDMDGLAHIRQFENQRLHAYKIHMENFKQYAKPRVWTHTSYFSDSKVKERMDMVDLDGEYRSFHENGRLKSQGKYRDGKPHGLWEHYSETGQLESEYNYSQWHEGNLYRGEIIYYRSGRVFVKDTYDSGHIITRRVYNEKGSILESMDTPNIKRIEGIDSVCGF